MLKITFKNVGQGDSIILEWKSKDLYKIGIIDCNLDEYNQNPVLNHLKYKQYTHVDFIILSHPHYDHFSGFNQLLDYCFSNQITIGNFLHTCDQVPEFLKTASRTAKAEKELAHLFLNLRRLRKSRIIQHHSYINYDRRDLEITDDIHIRFLAPSIEEKENYIRNQKVFNDESSPHNNPNANWLSTVLKIYSKDWYFLLTSDVERSVLKKLGLNHFGEFNGEIILGQSPHHGAFGNHYRAFWSHRIGKKYNMPIIFSVGKNHYQHPSKKAVEDFNKLNCKIYATNKVGALSSLSESLFKNVTEANAMLDMVSKLISKKSQSSILQGDQVFVIDNGAIQHLP